MSPTTAARRSVALIHNKPVHYQVRRSRRARSLSLHVSHHKGLEVVLPWRWTLTDVDRALDEHADWIDRQVDQYDVRRGPAVRELTTGHRVLVFGEPCALRLEALDGSRRRGRVSAENGSLRVRLAPEDRLDPRPALELWLRKLARTHLKARVRDLSAAHGFSPGKVIVGERTTRWGSCSSRGNLSFCYRLVMAPPAVIDAVVCHELCHLTHLNHGPRFHALQDRTCPDHRRLMAWLREHHDEMVI
ncbi:M48 family metallopeptidase [bacterium]|nr:M48 family metallopeptidase [bacterium]MBU1674931.1 M48 family metallopeptidase [bacterium]